MNSLQIEKLLKRDPRVCRYFLGCFSADMIPAKPQVNSLYPYCAVINTDVSGEPGTHWVAIFSPDPNHIEYFDSFALSPNEHIEAYLAQFPHIKQSKIVLQSIRSTICGRYVIYFITKRCSGETFNEIENHLDKKCKSHPNSVVNAFVSRRFDTGSQNE